MFLRSHHKCDGYLTPRHIRRSEMLAAWHATMVPFFQHGSVWKWMTIRNLNKLFLERSWKVLLSTFMSVSESLWNIDRTLTYLYILLLILTYVCATIYITRNSPGNVRTKFRHAAGPLQTNPFPKCCTDCPTMALKGYTGLLCWWHAGFRSHVHGKFSLLKHPILYQFDVGS